MSKASSAAVLPRGITKAFTFWQDREIRFDSTSEVLTMRPNAEVVLATFHHVEDTKGNNGQVGTLLLTNLRLLWWSARHRTVNLSIGYFCVLSITVQETQSKMSGGSAEAVFISCKFGASRFMFVFTYVPRPDDDVHGVESARSHDGQTRLFAAATAAWRSYETSKAYREIRLRAAIIAEGNLILLAGESVLSKVSKVSNVSKESGHVGTLITTNLRVVWFASSTDNFNVSIPYMQFVAVRSQSSRFGPALVIETSSYAGNFVLGFRVEPVERLAMLYHEIASLWKAWTNRPTLGMKMSLTADDAAALATGSAAESEGFQWEGGGKEGGATARATAATRIRETAIIEQTPRDVFAAYYADEGQKGVDRKPVFDPSIGLAVEKLRKGVTLKDLWSVTVK